MNRSSSYVSCPGGTGECIRNYYLCDNRQHCLDWSDEWNEDCIRSECASYAMIGVKRVKRNLIYILAMYRPYKFSSNHD